VGIINDSLARVVCKVPALDLTAFALGRPDPIDTSDHALTTGPSPEDAAEALGYRLYFDGEDPHPPDGMPLETMMRFYTGYYTARMDHAREKDRDRMAWIAWLDEVNAEPHPAELIEHGCASGHPSFEG
jgi:hypothetical protein